MNILVIGAGQGVGRTLARMLRDRGHQVIAGLHTDRGSDRELDGIRLLPMDVTNEDQLREDAKIIRKEVQQLDCIVSVAGVLLPSDRTCTLLDEPVEDLQKQMDVNAIGVVLAFRSLYPLLRENSRFFVLTSEGGSFSSAGSLFSGYSVSKTAANKYVQVLRVTCEEKEIPVDLIAVHPGRVDTAMGHTTAQITPEESAGGIIDLIEGTTPIDSQRHWFIDYQGRPMPL